MPIASTEKQKQSINAYHTKLFNGEYGVITDSGQLGIEYAGTDRGTRQDILNIMEVKEKMCDDKESLETLKAENMALKEKISKYEEAEKTKEVESVLAEVRGVFSEDEVSELRKKSEDFSLETINAFKNEVKAKAFEAMKNVEEKNTKSFTKMDINSLGKENKKSKYLW